MKRGLVCMKFHVLAYCFHLASRCRGDWMFWRQKKISKWGRVEKLRKMLFPEAVYTVGSWEAFLDSSWLLVLRYPAFSSQMKITPHPTSSVLLTPDNVPNHPPYPLRSHHGFSGINGNLPGEAPETLLVENSWDMAHTAFNCSGAVPELLLPDWGRTWESVRWRVHQIPTAACFILGSLLYMPKNINYYFDFNHYSI